METAFRTTVAIAAALALIMAVQAAPALLMCGIAAAVMVAGVVWAWGDAETWLAVTR